MHAFCVENSKIYILKIKIEKEKKNIFFNISEEFKYKEKYEYILLIIKSLVDNNSYWNKPYSKINKAMFHFS